MSMESLQAAADPAPFVTSTSATNALPLVAPVPFARRLREVLTRTQHPHLGYFESANDGLAQALDKHVARCARMFSPDSLVLVPECGLGGAVHQLATLGHRAVGIDRDPATIALARARATSPRARFLASSMTDFAERARGARVDVLLLNEVLAQHADLRAVLLLARALLRPGGLVLVNEVVRHPAILPTNPARHALGAVRAAADACGFDLVETRDISNRTAPTLPRLLRLLAERRSDLAQSLGSTPEGAAELARSEQRLRADELAFTRQELFYESTALRLGARFAHDSVVLRTSTKKSS
ncbi:MAG: methyltransferase domain-containing protein [Planctomycetota bacterium]